MGRDKFGSRPYENKDVFWSDSLPTYQPIYKYFAKLLTRKNKQALFLKFLTKEDIAMSKFMASIVDINPVLDIALFYATEQFSLELYKYLIDDCGAKPTLYIYNKLKKINIRSEKDHKKFISIKKYLSIKCKEHCQDYEDFEDPIFLKRESKRIQHIRSRRIVE